MNHLPLCHRDSFDGACELRADVHAVCIFNMATGHDSLHKISLFNPQSFDLGSKPPMLNRRPKGCQKHKNEDDLQAIFVPNFLGGLKC